MSITILGEITADGQNIYVMGLGDPADLATAAQYMETVTPKVHADGMGLTMPLTWPACVQLATMFSPIWRPGPRLAAWIAGQISARLAPRSDDLSFALPPELEPRPYQVDGAHMIANTGGGLLFDEQGTGKTVTALLGLREAAARGQDVLPALILCPAGGVIRSWLRHVETWAPDWSAVAWRGPGRRRLAGLHDIYVCSYQTCRIDAQTMRGPKAPLMNMGFRSVILDESHRIKTPGSKQSLAARRVGSKATSIYLSMTGTPISHSPKDTWPSLVSLEPGAWEAQDRFDNRYLATVANDYGEPDVIGLARHAEPEFWQCLLGRHRRVAKADVLTHLPPKIYSIREIEIPGEWRKAYDQMETAMRADLPDGTEMLEMWAISARNRLIQMASAAWDAWTTTEIVMEDGIEVEKQKQHVQLRAPSWKVDELLAVMEERPDKQVIAFAGGHGSRQLLMIAGEAATQAGLRVGYVVGNQSNRVRDKAIDDFQAGLLDLICVTTSAGGVGLTLTAASTEVFLQRPYSLLESMQAEDRAHRIGSEIHDAIEIIDLVAVDTIESRVREILYEHGGQFSDFVKDPRIIAELLGGPKVPRQRGASQRHLEAVAS